MPRLPVDQRPCCEILAILMIEGYLKQFIPCCRSLKWHHSPESPEGLVLFCWGLDPSVFRVTTAGGDTVVRACDPCRGPRQAGGTGLSSVPVQVRRPLCNSVPSSAPLVIHMWPGCLPVGPALQAWGIARAGFPDPSGSNLFCLVSGCGGWRAGCPACF